MSLSNPLAIVAADPAAKAVKKVNTDTGNSLSWLAVGGGVLVLYVLYQVVKTVGKVGNTAGGLLDELQDAVTTDPDSGGGNVGGGSTTIPYGASINTIQAETIAAELANIMGSFGRLNERETVQILNILSGKTPIDYVMISNAFGLVRRNPITGEVAPPLLGQQLNLTDWLTIELQPTGIQRLRQVMPGVF